MGQQDGAEVDWQTATLVSELSDERGAGKATNLDGRGDLPPAVRLYMDRKYQWARLVQQRRSAAARILVGAVLLVMPRVLPPARVRWSSRTMTRLGLERGTACILGRVS